MGGITVRRAPEDELGSSTGAALYHNTSSGVSRLRAKRPYLLPLVSAALVLLVLIGGALVFQHLESPAEQAEAQEFLVLREQLLESFHGMPEDHQELLGRYLAVTDKYLYTRSTAPDDDIFNWSFMGSLYFCVTVVTTIGYGSYTPVTDSGKLFLLFYVLVGIPSFVMMLTIVSEAILACVKKIAKHSMLSMVERGWLEKTPSIRTSTVVIAVMAVFTTLFVLCWSCLFSVYNQWTYLDSVYFGLVTVTTIGFGDFAPNTGEVVGSLLLLPPSLASAWSSLLIYSGRGMLEPFL